MTLTYTAAKPRRKYRNQPTTVDGIRFASKAEARRYAELRLLEKAGQITGLELQPRYQLTCRARTGRGQHKVGEYIADFIYFEGNKVVVEDVKSPPTAKNALFRWKLKHFEAEYGIKLTLIGV